jgi:hypothetical protein
MPMLFSASIKAEVCKRRLNIAAPGGLPVVG